MSANSCADNALQETRSRAEAAQSWQCAEATGVAAYAAGKNAGAGRACFGLSLANSKPDNSMPQAEPAGARAISRKALPCSHLRGYAEPNSGPKSAARQGKLIARSRFVRWSKFNFVGGIGIAVQFAALFLLKSVFHVHYLAATALAVEAAVLHNFIWHERFTWADRIKPDRIKQQGSKRDRSSLGQTKSDGPFADAPALYRRSLLRLARFHLGNGAVSILGNVALMKVMVGVGHMNYLVANAIAITLCSVANFLVSDDWVFEE
jgi:putative flippase GtrA